MTDEKTADSLDQTVDAEKTAAEIEIAIATIIEEKLQPSVAMHGGQISLKEWDHANGIATIFMSGACSGCAMSTQTLKMGVENTLKHYIPEVKVVHGEEDINSICSSIDKIFDYFLFWEGSEFNSIIFFLLSILAICFLL